MKELKFLIIICFFSSCISINYSNYRGSEVLSGSGGSVFNKKGVDFWENGEPDQKYKIIGIIDYKANDAPIQNAKTNKKIAKKVLEVSGDAVILFNEEKENRGTFNKGKINKGRNNSLNYNGNSINIIKKYRKYYVIKYVD